MLRIFFDFRPMYRKSSRPRSPRIANDLRQAAKKIETLAITTGRSIGITDEAFAARTKLAFEKLMTSINNNCVNIAVLLDRYNNLCKQLNLDPDSRLKELLARSDERNSCFHMQGDAAIAACSRAIVAGGPDLARLYGKRGLEYSKEKEYDRAISDYNEAIRIDPGDALFFNQRGSAFLQKGDYDRAIQEFSEAIELNPNDARSFSRRGDVYETENDYDRAIADYNEAIRLDPKDAFFFTQRGRVFDKTGEHDRAIREFDEAIRLDPSYTYALNLRGKVYYDKKDYERAIEDQNEAIRINPNISSP